MNWLGSEKLHEKISPPTYYAYTFFLLGGIGGLFVMLFMAIILGNMPRITVWLWPFVPFIVAGIGYLYGTKMEAKTGKTMIGDIPTEKRWDKSKSWAAEYALLSLLLTIICLEIASLIDEFMLSSSFSSWRQHSGIILYITIKYPYPIVIVILAYLYGKHKDKKTRLLEKK